MQILLGKKSQMIAISVSKPARIDFLFFFFSFCCVNSIEFSDNAHSILLDYISFEIIVGLFAFFGDHKQFIEKLSFTYNGNVVRSSNWWKKRNPRQSIIRIWRMKSMDALVGEHLMAFHLDRLHDNITITHTYSQFHIDFVSWKNRFEWWIFLWFVVGFVRLSFTSTMPLWLNISEARYWYCRSVGRSMSRLNFECFVFIELPCKHIVVPSNMHIKVQCSMDVCIAYQIAWNCKISKKMENVWLYYHQSRSIQIQPAITQMHNDQGH